MFVIVHLVTPAIGRIACGGRRGAVERLMDERTIRPTRCRRGRAGPTISPNWASTSWSRWGSRARAGGWHVFELTTRAGQEPPEHTHATEDEIFYVLQGQLAFRCGGERFELTDGGCAFLPRGIPHGYQILSAERRETPRPDGTRAG